MENVMVRSSVTRNGRANAARLWRQGWSFQSLTCLQLWLSCLGRVLVADAFLVFIISAAFHWFEYEVVLQRQIANNVVRGEPAFASGGPKISG